MQLLGRQALVTRIRYVAIGSSAELAHGRARVAAARRAAVGLHGDPRAPDLDPGAPPRLVSAGPGRARARRVRARARDRAARPTTRRRALRAGRHGDRPAL